MDLSSILPSLDFHCINRHCTSYTADFNHLSDIARHNSVDISVYHDGRVSFTWSGDLGTETFYTKPTAKDLYDFAKLHS
jgi:hypothetical protein